VPLPLHVELSLPPGVESYVGSSPSSVAFSPDGTRVAFVGILEGKRQAYIRRLDQFEATPVKDTDLAASLNFSPNGRSLVAVLTNRTLKTLSLDDGLSLTLSKDVDYTAGAVWGPDDRITFGRNNALWQLPASGGEPTELTKLDTAKGELLHTHPALTADGRTLLFSVVTGSSRTNHIEALPLAPGGDRRVVLESGSSPLHMSSGHLLFLRSGALLAVPVEDGTLRVRGAPVRVVDEVRLSTLGSAMITAVSHTGSLAFMNGAIGSQLVWTSRQGGEERITGADRPYASPAVSPLTSRRLVASWNGDVWILDGDRAMKLTSDATSGNSYPVWTPDGKRVIFRTRTGMYWVDAEGSGQLEAIPESSINDYPNSVSPDGQWLAFLRISGETGGDVYVVSLRGDAKPRPLVATPAYEGGAQFSPDGRWVAFASDESGHYQVFVRPFTGENRKWLVSQSGRYPRWSGNGKELFYRDGSRMLAVDVTVAGQEPSFSAPRVLFDQRYQFGSAQVSANYDVSADGQRFVMVKDDPAANRLNVIINWSEELKRLAPAGR
jgi:Tol biopolymer transport system component